MKRLYLLHVSGIPGAKVQFPASGSFHRKGKYAELALFASSYEIDSKRA